CVLRCAASAPDMRGLMVVEAAGTEPGLSRPKLRPWYQSDRAKQLSIDCAQASTPQLARAHEPEHFVMSDRGEWPQLGQQPKYARTILHRAKREFSAHGRMAPDVVVVQQQGELGLAMVQVVDSYRGIDQNHAARSRRRDAATSSGSVPPRAARRRALSTRMRVSNP